MDILVRQDYSPQQIRREQLREQEFRRNRYTSGSANLDDMIALGKAVILCGVHVRRFSPKAARYLAHPSKKLRRVNGCCDICNAFDLCFLFLNEKDALEERMKVEKYNRVSEYGIHYNGS